MRSFVFTDESLRRQAGRFVWLAIDTEKAVNAPFRTKYVLEAWPTFFIVDPASETVVLKWLGGATVPQLEKILDDGRRAYQQGKAGKPKKADDLGQSLAEADRLYGAAKNAEAAKAYRELLARAPKGWPAYGRATESLLFTLQRTEQNEACTTIAKAAFPRLKKTPDAANIAASGLSCALSLAPEAANRAELITHFVAASREVLADRTTKIAADDRSSVYETLVQERDEAKDAAGMKEAAAAWATFLEGEAARARSPEAAAVYDSHRLSAYLQMATPEKAVPMLQASEKALPEDYNPPARLAVA
ncbi:MAG: thiol reductase thioredoxin, partial [Thermoanaerobaculia bacterium]